MHPVAAISWLSRLPTKAAPLFAAETGPPAFSLIRRISGILRIEEDFKV